MSPEMRNIHFNSPYQNLSGYSVAQNRDLHKAHLTHTLGTYYVIIPVSAFQPW